jgi:hypothetical protein
MHTHAYTHRHTHAYTHIHTQHSTHPPTHTHTYTHTHDYNHNHNHSQSPFASRSFIHSQVDDDICLTRLRKALIEGNDIVIPMLPQVDNIFATLWFYRQVNFLCSLPRNPPFSFILSISPLLAPPPPPHTPSPPPSSLHARTSSSFFRVHSFALSPAHSLTFSFAHSLT